MIVELKRKFFLILMIQLSLIQSVDLSGETGNIIISVSNISTFLFFIYTVIAISWFE